jgi:hypothetical protein
MPDSTDQPSASVIKVAFEKLFGGGRGVEKLARSGLRFVNLGDGVVLIEQNPKNRNKWAQLANEGHKVAWVIREGKYLARVLDGEVLMLE